MSLFFFYTGVCMTSTIDMMGRRRSVAPHLLAEPAPDAAQLEALLTLASRVPDHGKLTPWRFIVIQGGARLRLGDAIAGFAVTDDPSLDAKRIETERQRLARAPLVIAIVSRPAPHAKIPEWEQMLSSGASCMALTLAANAMGFASAWLTEWYGYDLMCLGWRHMNALLDLFISAHRLRHLLTVHARSYQISSRR
jgi:nitroreductase